MRIPTLYLFLLAILCATACQRSELTSPQKVAVKANPQSKRLLGNFAEVAGTTFLLAPVMSNNHNKYLFGSSYGYDSKTHNYVFLDTGDDSTRMLAPNNDGVFVTALALPEDNSRSDSYTGVRSPAPNAARVEWWLYGVVKADSDNDKDLDMDDRRVIAVSDAGGAGYTELVTDVEHVFGHKLTSPETLKVIYRREARYFVATINLPGRRVSETQTLPTFGTDLP